jgi:hypothetical protein
MALTNSKQQKTLERIFKEPTPNDIPWPDIESLFKHVGCTIKHRGGSKVAFEKKDKVLFMHRPHPQTQTPTQNIRRIKAFLKDLGAEP